MKKVLKWIGVVFGALFLLMVLQLGWGMYREPIAKQQVLDFCASVKVGQGAEDIVERALHSGAEPRMAKWSQDQGGIRVMHVTYVGMPPFSRHMCVIKADMLVVSAEYIYMD